MHISILFIYFTALYLQFLFFILLLLYYLYALYIVIYHLSLYLFYFPQRRHLAKSFHILNFEKMILTRKAKFLRCQCITLLLGYRKSSTTLESRLTLSIFIHVVVYQYTKLFFFWTENNLILTADALLKTITQLLFVSEWMQWVQESRFKNK